MVPSVYVSVAEPARFKSSVLLSAISIGLIYVIVGVCGYFAAGSTVGPNMIDSMRLDYVNPKTFVRKVSAMGYIVALMIVLHVFISFALILNGTLTAAEMTVSGAQNAKDVGGLTSKLTRTGVILLAALLVWTLPFFGDLVNLVSAFGCVITQVPYPLLAYGMLFQRSAFQKVWHYFLFGFSAISVVYGAATAIEKLATNAPGEIREKFGQGSDLPTEQFQKMSGVGAFFLNYQYWEGSR